LYKKAESGEIAEFTGVTSPYEEPEKAEIVVETDVMTVEECDETIKKYLSDCNLIAF